MDDLEALLDDKPPTPSVLKVNAKDIRCSPKIIQKPAPPRPTTEPQICSNCKCPANDMEECHCGQYNSWTFFSDGTWKFAGLISGWKI